MMLCFISSAITVHAQDTKIDQYEAKKMTKKTNDEFRASLGLNVSKITGDNPSFDNVLGVQAGIEVPILNFSNYFGLGLGVAYSQQGGKYKSTEYIPGGNYGSSSATNRLNYLNFPLLVHYQKSHQGFYAEAGVQPGILLSAKNKGANTTDIKDELKKFDVGVPIGAGYKFKNKFGAGVRFTPGLMKINKDGDSKYKNMVVSLRASYAL